MIIICNEILILMEQYTIHDAVFSYLKHVCLIVDLEIENLVSGKILLTNDEAGRKQWVCVECNYHQKLKNDVVKHVERRHLNLKLACSMCQHVTNSRSDLKTHMRSHLL